MIDLSNNSPKAIYPGSEDYIFNTKPHHDIGARSTVIRSDLHYGTHIDAPSHFGYEKTMSDFPIGLSKGVCQIININSKNHLTKNELSKIAIKSKVLILNFIYNPSLNDAFDENYFGVEEECATYMTEVLDLDILGTNYLSIEPFENKNGETHKALLKNDTWIIEGINTENKLIEEGLYNYYCFPLNNTLEASPIRFCIEMV